MNQPDKFMGKYRIESNRLKGYDYTSTGAYFLTVCSHRRLPIFGKVVQGEMHLSPLGQIVWDEWFRSGEIRTEIHLDAFVVMPDHIHGLVFLQPEAVLPAPPSQRFAVPSYPPKPVTPAQAKGPPPKSIGAFMAGFKSAVTQAINQARQSPGAPVWQRNYHDRIVHDIAHVDRIRAYIINNPRNWSIKHDPTRDID